MSHDFKVCPSCHEEYTPTPTTCVECGTPLVYLDELEVGPAPESFPEVSELSCVRVGPLPWTRAISDALEAAAIPHRVEPDSRTEAEGGVNPQRFGEADLFGTWVRPQDLDSAKKIDHTLFGQLGGDPAQNEAASEEETCPACEASLPIDALECPDCGLGFG